MLSIVTAKRYDEQRPLIFAARNVHTSFIKAAALLDFDVEWLYPEHQSHLCACKITAESLKAALSDAKKLPCAVYVTSPDYLGNILDVAGLSKVCDEYGLPLLVDNAHGAYLKFTREDSHPITLGAAMCADSAHKTLPVLTGGAYLHVSKKFPEYARDARRALSLFASTSPSYLTLSSLDLCNARLSEDYAAAIREACATAMSVKRALSGFGFFVESTEPLKIVINSARSGMSGDELCTRLRDKRIEAEFCDRDYLVLMLTPNNSEDDIKRLIDAFGEISVGIKNGVAEASPIPKKHESVMSIRGAVLSPCELIRADEALGRICASPTVSCPPAVPIVISGERITEEDIELFKYYGVERINVVAEK